MIASARRNSWVSTITPEAWAFSRTCSGRDAPMIAEATLGSRSTQASANCGSVSPASSAIGFELLHRAQHLGLHQPVHVAAHLVARGARVCAAAAGRDRICR